jgi:sugar/nucleoside kinase (ribokinase family)
MISSEIRTKSPVVVVGNINLDIKTSLVPASPSMFTDGETSVEDIYESLGGGGANVAVAAACLGGSVHFYGCLGRDELGERLENALHTLGIAPHMSRVDAPTGRSINLNWDNHHRHFVSSLANNRRMASDHIDLAELTGLGCGHLFRADVWFSEPMLDGGNEIVLKTAQTMGMETSIDINADPEWNGPTSESRLALRKAQIAGVLPYVTWAHGNERELGIFSGQDNTLDACKYLLDNGARGVIVHRGPKGAAALDREIGWVEVPPTNVDKVLCETGAGDVFSAAFMLLNGLPLPERLAECGRIAARHLEGNPNLLPRL